MKQKYLHENAITALGLYGDFKINPTTMTDGYGVSRPLELDQVQQVAQKTDWFTNEIVPPAPAKPEVVKIDTETIVVPVPESKSKVASSLETEAKGLNGTQKATAIGAGVGLLYALYKGSGISGIAIYGGLGAAAGYFGYAFYTGKNEVVNSAVASVKK